MVFKLLARSVRHEWGRMLSGVLGVAAATTILAWHVGLATTAVHSGLETARRAAAPFNAWVTSPAEGFGGGGPGRGPKVEAPGKKGRARATAEATMGRRMARRGGRPVPKALIDALDASPMVKGTLAMATIGVTMDARPGGRVLQGPPFAGTVAKVPERGLPFAGATLEGRLPDDASDEPEAVASESLFGARVPKPDQGSSMPFVLSGGTVSVKFVGFFKSTSLVQAFPSIYVNKAAFEAIKRLSPEFRDLPNLVLVETARGVDPADIGLVLDSVPEADSCPLYTVDAVSRRFRSDTVSNLLTQMPMSLAIGAIAACCLLATVLSIGLELQRRRIAELRCAGMTRSGVVRLVAAEMSMLVVPGYLLGLAIAAAALQAFLSMEGAGGEMPHTVHFGWQTPLACAALAVAVGCLALVVPAARAARVRPLDAVTTDVSVPRPVFASRAIAAILLLVPMPVIAMDFALPERVKSLLMLLVGLPCLVLSLAFGMHPFLRLVERLFTDPVGRLLRLDPRLLQRRLDRNPARTAGTILTIALGLGGFVAVHIWGGTLMSSFTPSPEWPDVIVSALPGGFSGGQVEALRGCDGVADGRALPIECTQFPMTLGDGSSPDGVLLVFGANPVEAFGERPLAPLRMVEGDLGEASRLLADDRHCIITKMLSNITGLHLGDSFSVGGRTLEVAGVADLNWHMVTSRSEVRTRFGELRRHPSPNGQTDKRTNGPTMQRTMGMAFTSESFARSLTRNEDRTYFVWLDMSPELRAMNPLKASVLLDSRIRAAVGDDGSSAIRVHHRDEISDGTLAHGNDILGAMARIPLWSLAVTSTGIAVLLVASARGSRREFEVMRAVGMTPSQLGRLLFGEALLVTIAAVALSLVCGALVGWSFTGLSRWMMAAGLDVKLIVPWATIARGVLFAVALCTFFAILPIRRLVK